MCVKLIFVGIFHCLAYEMGGCFAGVQMGKLSKNVGTQ